MKFFVAFTALVALAAASPYQKPSHNADLELQQIMNAINSPSTNPATAELLMQMLAEQAGFQIPDISPVLVDVPVVEPADDDFAPAVVDSASPLVQIIINVKQPASGIEVGSGPEPVHDDVQVVELPPLIPGPGVVVVDLPEHVPEVSPVIVADLPPPPAVGVVVADLPAPPSVGVAVADLPAPPSVGVAVADLPAPPVVDVAVADLPSSPVVDVAVADLPASPVIGVGVANLPASPVIGVGVANLPASPVIGVGVADLPASPVIGVGVANLV